MTKDEIARARRARALLANEDIQAAFEDVARDMWSAWRFTAHDEQGQREVTHAELRALDRVRSKLEGWAAELIRHGIT